MTPAFFYVFSLGKPHLFLDLLYIRFGNIISQLTNILPTSLLFCRLKTPFTPCIINLFSPRMPKTCPKTIRLTSFYLEKFRDRVKISEN